MTEFRECLRRHPVEGDDAPAMEIMLHEISFKPILCMGVVLLKNLEMSEEMRVVVVS